MTQQKHRRGSRAERLLDMAEDVALDCTVREIAKKYDIAVSTAHQDIKDIKADWLASRNETIEQARAIHSARLVRFIREMWEAWFASKGVQIKLREVQKRLPPEARPGLLVADAPLIEILDDGAFLTVEQIRQSYVSPGNPRFAEMLLGAYDQLAKIEGLYAAKEIHLNVTKYLQEVAEELGIEAAELIREAEDVAEAAWKHAAG